MLSGVVQCISRLMAERTGTGMEPEHSELGLDERANESDAGQEHLYRLFIGWVPKTFSESDLLPLFQKYGDVKDVIILKDKVSGQPRGCAFVSYGTREEADAAIQALDKGVHLPGALCPIEVRTWAACLAYSFTQANISSSAPPWLHISKDVNMHLHAARVMDRPHVWDFAQSMQLSARQAMLALPLMAKCRLERLTCTSSNDC
eukprot:GHRR01021926.1.p1 GENE.GHRR01021926.1~~GHRR01021926.1.p1  ORF type:complete len:204 (+),score=39.25 GHRR01021926.1:226-837(+)